jgi:hypothetical protein
MFLYRRNSVRVFTVDYHACLQLITHANLRKPRKIKLVFFLSFVIHHTIPSYTIFDVALDLKRRCHKTSHTIQVYNYYSPPPYSRE